MLVEWCTGEGERRVDWGGWVNEREESWDVEYLGRRLIEVVEIWCLIEVQTLAHFARLARLNAQ